MIEIEISEQSLSYESRFDAAKALQKLMEAGVCFLSTRTKKRKK